MLAGARVVLVRTHYAGNIGSVARAMKNFGLRDLVLVDPIARVVDHQARMLATHGVDILDAARVVPTLEEAVADCVLVYATSAETSGTLRETIRGTPEVLLPRFLAALPQGPAALVFGPEPHGLANEEIARCHGLMYFSTTAEYSSLNLALAVGICLYELHKLTLTQSESPATERKASRAPAAYADLERMYQHLEVALTRVSYLYGQNAGALMSAFRHLLGRAMPTMQEVKMLHGLARQLEFVARYLPKNRADLPGDRPPPPEL